MEIYILLLQETINWVAKEYKLRVLFTQLLRRNQDVTQGLFLMAVL